MQKPGSPALLIRLRTGALLIALVTLPCNGADQTSDLRRVREVNLERATRLPNFVADEMALRYQKGKGAKAGRRVPVLLAAKRLLRNLDQRGKQFFKHQTI